MRKKIGTGKRTAVAILAAAMIMSGMGVPESCQSYPYAVSAAENEEQPEVDTHTLTDADADSESKQAESEQTDSGKDNKKIDDKEDSKEKNKGKDKEAVDVSEFEQADPYEMSSFADMLNSDQLYFTNEKADVKAEEDGVHIAGKNKNIQGQKLVIKKMFDFGETGAGTIRFDAISKRGKKVIAKFYLDDSTEPFVECKIPLQNKTDDWFMEGDSLIEIQNDNIKGNHYISVEFYDADTAEDKKTEVSVRNIQFFKKTGLPIVDINIDESYAPISGMVNDKKHQTECYGKISISVPEGFESGYSDEGLTEYTGGEYKLDYIRGRGNSTWTEDKKPYKIKLEDGANLFGMGTNKHWTLIAEKLDNSLIRNRITYYLGEQLGMEYTPQLVPVDVNMNGQYIGCYYLCEQIRVDNSRVEIDDLEKIKSDNDDISGGYLLGMSPYTNSDKVTFATKHGVRFEIESPTEISGKNVSDEKLSEMNSYIKDYMNDLDEAIYGDGFKNNSGKSYTEYMDLESAAKYWLIQEFTQNGDAFITPSTYLYKKKDGKLYWGPLWDFDYVAWDSSGYIEDEDSYSGFINRSPWFVRLMHDNEFRSKVIEVWGGKDSQDPATLAYQLNELVKDGGIIDQYEAQLNVSAENNFYKWGFTSFSYDALPSGEYMIDYDGNEITIPESMREHNYYEEYTDDEFNIIHCETYHDEIEKLKRWINNRINWMDENLSEEALNNSNTVTFYDGDKKIDEIKAYLGQLDKMPEEPQREGYVFDGWYEECEVPEEFSDGECEDEGEDDESHNMVNKIYEGCGIDGNVKAYAKWIPEDEVDPVEEIHVLEKEIYVGLGAHVSLNYTCIPSNSLDSSVKITSADGSIAVIDGDTVLGVKEGKTEVKITAPNGIEETVKVNVVNNSLLREHLNEFSVSENEIEMKAGDIKAVDFTMEPLWHCVQTVEVQNVNSDIAEMDISGVIYAHKAGDAVIVVSNNLYDTPIVIKVSVKGDDSTPKADSESEKKQDEAKSDEAKSNEVKLDEHKTNEQKTIEQKNAEQKNPEPKNVEQKTVEQKAAETKTAEQQVTQQPITEQNVGKSDNKKSSKKIDKLKKGTTFESGNLKYEVVKSGSLKKGKVTGGKVKVVGISSKGQKSDSIVVPASVSYKRNTFKITEIGSKAFTGNEKIKTAVIGKYVTKVGKCAFSDCTKLKKVTVNGKNAKFSKKAFKDTDKELKVYVPAAKIKTYKKRLAKIGVAKNKVVKKEK